MSTRRNDGKSEGVAVLLYGEFVEGCLRFIDIDSQINSDSNLSNIREWFACRCGKELLSAYEGDYVYPDMYLYVRNSGDDERMAVDSITYKYTM